MHSGPRKPVLQNLVQRFDGLWAYPGWMPTQFGATGHADPIAQAGDGHFKAFIHHSTAGCIEVFFDIGAD